MIKEIYPYLLVALLGAFVHILRELARLEKIVATFKLRIWLKKNKYSTLYGVGLTLLAIIILWSTKELNWGSAALAGYAGDSIVKTKLSQQTKIENNIEDENGDSGPEKEFNPNINTDLKG